MRKKAHSPTLSVFLLWLMTSCSSPGIFCENVMRVKWAQANSISIHDHFTLPTYISIVIRLYHIHKSPPYSSILTPRTRLYSSLEGVLDFPSCNIPDPSLLAVHNKSAHYSYIMSRRTPNGSKVDKSAIEVDRKEARRSTLPTKPDC